MPVVTFPGRPLVSYPGLSFFYKVLYTGTIIARLPIWTVGFALFRSMRPHTNYSFKQSMLVKIFSKLLSMSARTETPVPLPLEPGKEGDRWETLEPFPKDVYRGSLASESVEPAIIGGTWYPQKPTDPADGEPIMLHIHGGGFVVGTGRIDDSGAMCEVYQQHGKVGHMFLPQYRLSSRPTSAPFPAALQDSLTSYLYLVRTLGIPGSDIILSGDSAGGNLAIALLRYIAEHGTELGIPQPACAIIVAPWVAPVKTLWPAITFTSNPNFHSDFLGADLTRWGASTYMAGGVSPDDPYIMPLGNPFATPVPMLVTFGAAEILAVDGLEWVKEMSRVEGNELETYIEPDAPHDTVLLGHVLGFQESAAKVAEKMGKFIKEYV